MTDRDRTLEVIRRRNWRVVLLGPRAKKPHTKEWQITTDADRAAAHLDDGGNLGLLGGKDNGLAILDPDAELPWAEMIDCLGQPALPWTLTGSGRLHYYVAWEPDLPAKLTWNGVIIGEIQRGPGLQQVVIPPSIHPTTGLRYRWITESLPALVEAIDPVHDPLPRLPGVWLAYLRSHVYR